MEKDKKWSENKKNEARKCLGYWKRRKNRGKMTRSIHNNKKMKKIFQQFQKNGKMNKKDYYKLF